MYKIKKTICFPKNCRTEGTSLGHPVFKSEAYLRLVSIPPGDQRCGSEKACRDSANENSKAWQGGTFIGKGLGYTCRMALEQFKVLNNCIKNELCKH